MDDVSCLTTYFYIFQLSPSYDLDHPCVCYNEPQVASSIAFGSSQTIFRASNILSYHMKSNDNNSSHNSPPSSLTQYNVTMMLQVVYSLVHIAILTSSEFLYIAILKHKEVFLAQPLNLMFSMLLIILPLP